MATRPRVHLTTQQLEYLVAIDRHDTWADAAAAVGVSPSALSQGIGELERRLGATLFRRDGRRRVPSRDHTEVLRYAERTLAATDDLARWLARRSGGTAGEVRLGMIDAAATHHWRETLRRHREDRPDVELRLTVAPSADLLRRLGRAELDIVVCVAPHRPVDGLELRPLLDDPLAVLAPASEADRAPSRWGPWVTFPDGSHTRSVVEAALRAAGAPVEVVAESHQPDVLREMVVLGVGWSVLPAAGLPVDDRITIVRDALAVRRLVLATRVGAPDHPAAADLAGRLLER